MTLGAADPVAFVATTDAARARRFYEDVLGLRFVGDEPFALVFDAHGVMLRIQKVDRPGGYPYTKLGWRVADIRSMVRDLTARGVTFERYASLDQDGDAIWTSPSRARVAWFKDPDGNTLSLTQF